MVIVIPNYVFFFFLVYFERESARIRAQGRGRERGERIPSRLRVVSTEPDTGLDLTNREIMTPAETQSQVLNRLSHAAPPHPPHPFLSRFLQNYILQPLKVPCPSLLAKDSEHRDASLSNTHPSKQECVLPNIANHQSFFGKNYSPSVVMSLSEPLPVSFRVQSRNGTRGPAGALRCGLSASLFRDLPPGSLPNYPAVLSFTS